MKAIIQLTDTHIRAKGQLAYERIDTSEFLMRAVNAIEQLSFRPSAIVLTGDLTETGRPEEYAHLAEILSKLTTPYFLIPGNHDDRDVLRHNFSDYEYIKGCDKFIQYTVDLGEILLVAIDTSSPGFSEGALCQERLAWLDQTLTKNEHRSVVVAMHHPPFKTYMQHMDVIGLNVGRDSFVEIIQKFPKIERIICGHLHRSIEARIGTTVACTAPSPAYQVELNLDQDGSSAWLLEPPCFKVHAWINGPDLVTHTAYIGGFDGPHSFE